jgi:UDP-N-acetyl-D-mannosaminuronate dehydrogenase
VNLLDFPLESQPVLPRCREADGVVLLTDHCSFDYEAIVNQSSLIVDTRNAFRTWRMEKIVRL